MGIIKKHTTGSQSIDIRCLRLGVTTQATDPIIEIIDGDQQNIGPAPPTFLSANKQVDRQANARVKKLLLIIQYVLWFNLRTSLSNRG